ncbi:MAG: aldehyde dehydrogenase [Treponema sp.]|nr:aldehyde dehydrogenase [Treponema sp.]MBR5032543.1 aldehyde dehydrogenase [Treponema sp.]
MQQLEMQAILQKQRAYFKTGATLPLKFRIDALKKLQSYIKKNEQEITSALTTDLGKSAIEGFMCEIGLVLSEISYMLKNIKKFAADEKKKTCITNFAAKSYVKKSPRGVILIMSPWNYPFLLTLEPLVDALAAGNTAIIKPSAYSAATSKVIDKMMKECFAPEYVTVITGGRAENQSLLEQKFDYIFFTGSHKVGREVMKKAADNFTPVTLELGGKSPCIVDKTAKIALAAKRIVWGKFLNCGQTCVAPDFILCHESIKTELITALKQQILVQFGVVPLANNSYGKIINKKHFDRICSLIDPSKIVCGGKSDAAILKIEPTIMDNISWKDPVMTQEIFGPVLPVLTYSTEEELLHILNSRARPLALYLFTTNQALEQKILSRCSFGGGCVNDTIVHLATNNMGFGGVGESGMGAYHGKVGFDTFSHTKTIVNKKNWIDVKMRYQPYTGAKERVLRRFLK